MEGKKIGSLHCDIIMNVKLSLWSAIKLRIVGLKNTMDDIHSEVNINLNTEARKKEIIDIVNEAKKNNKIEK